MKWRMKVHATEYEEGHGVERAGSDVEKAGGQIATAAPSLWRRLLVLLRRLRLRRHLRPPALLALEALPRRLARRRQLLLLLLLRLPRLHHRLHPQLFLLKSGRHPPRCRRRRAPGTRRGARRAPAARAGRRRGGCRAGAPPSRRGAAVGGTQAKVVPPTRPLAPVYRAGQATGRL